MNNNCLSAFYTLSITICAVYLSFDFFYKINKVKKKKQKNKYIAYHEWWRKKWDKRFVFDIITSTRVALATPTKICLISP